MITGVNAGREAVAYCGFIGLTDVATSGLSVCPSDLARYRQFPVCLLW